MLIGAAELVDRKLGSVPACLTALVVASFCSGSFIRFIGCNPDEVKVAVVKPV